VTVPDPDRILLVRLSHMGDVVHALGVFHALHAAYPRARIAWAIQPEFAGLLAGLPGLERVIPFERRGGIGAWWRLARELARFRPDWTIDAQANAKSGAVARLSRAPRRSAPHRADWQEPWAAWTAREHAPALVPPARHAMQRMEALVRALVPGARLPLRMDAALDAEERERGERLLVARTPAAGSDPVLLHLSSPEDVRGWPRGRWRELVVALAARGKAIVVLSGPAEAELHHALARELPADARVTHWVDQRGLRELAAVFTAAARRGWRMVCCDSGPLHLAAAHGLAVVALEGPQDAARTGPWPLAGAAHAVVRTPDVPECAPCLARRCRHPEGAVCMCGITAGHVLAALGRAQ
jgi:ADP-heptose:LPS heptosyltransferase